MKMNVVKRMLSGALALSLVLAPSISTAATNRGTVAPVAEATQSGGGAAASVIVRTVRDSYTVGGVKSSIGGSFILNKGIGVATTTSLNDIATGYSLSAGARPYVKAYDMDTKKSNLAKEAMDGVAAAYGATAFGYINFELGQMSGGRYSLLSGGNGIQVVLGIPTKNLQAGANYGVICVQEGGVATLLTDATANDGVITVTLPAGRSALALVKY